MQTVTTFSIKIKHIKTSVLLRKLIFLGCFWKRVFQCLGPPRLTHPNPHPAHPVLSFPWGCENEEEILNQCHSNYNSHSSSIRCHSHSHSHSEQSQPIQPQPGRLFLLRILRFWFQSSGNQMSFNRIDIKIMWVEKSRSRMQRNTKTYVWNKDWRLQGK